jgi:SAM-dependent methyltransferase
MHGIKSWKNHKGNLLDSKDGFDVIECESCGFKHIVPVPAPEELEQIYKHEYYTKEKPHYIERYTEDLEWWNMVYSERYDVFESLLSNERRRILDVGSGPGYFLAHGKNRGWNCIGLEPSICASKHSNELGLDIISEFLSERMQERMGLFDVIHMSEVLEHAPNPSELVYIAANMLNKGGLICVIVPNDYSPFQYVLRNVGGYEPWWVAPPHHINYFDPKSLTFLIASKGFDIVLQESTFPIDMFLLMGDNYVGNDDLGRLCHTRRKKFELNMSGAGMSDLKHRLFREFFQMGIGREIMVIGRKI